MKKRITTILYILSAAFLLTACNRQEETVSSILATADQIHADSLSAKLLDNPDIQKAQLQVSKLFESDSISISPEGLKAAKQAAIEISLQSIQFTLANDPKNPKFLWFCHAPRSWHGISLPGSRFGYDNPDNVYRIAFVDSNSTYEIKVHHNQNQSPIQESFELLETGEISRQIAFVEGKKLKVDKNGDYTITVSNEADSSNPNHLYLNKALGLILYRNTLSDWSKQLPTSIEIKRKSGFDTTAAPSDAQIVTSVIKNIAHFSKFLSAFKQSWTYGKNKVNQLGKPFERDGGWGFALAGYYNIPENEAWIITLNPKGAKYVGFELADPWLNSLDYVHHQGSLNNNQAKADKDGNITYVISAKDPGVQNWLDNAGDAHGSLLIRWQFLPDSIKNIDNAIVSQQIIKIVDLPNTLSPNVQKVTPEERKKLLEERSTSFIRRLGNSKE